MLWAAANGHNPARRQEASAAIGTIGPKPRAVRLVEEALSDQDPSVRQLAARTLGEMRAKAAIPKLKQALDDESTEVSFAAAKSLWDMGDRSGRDVFGGILGGEKSSSPGMVKGELQTAQEVTKDRSASARATSVALLGRDATPDAVRELDDPLSDKNWIVRAASAQALGACGQREQVASPESLLQDDKSAVRYMAAASIIRLSAVKVAPASGPSGAPKSTAPAPAPLTPTTSKQGDPMKIRIVSLVLLAVVVAPSCWARQNQMSDKAVQRIQKEVRHELVMLPYLDVFDNLAYKVDGSTVRLLGQVTRPSLKSDAERVVKGIEGVDRVDNQIEVLPPSPMDDQLRRRLYRAIYGFSSLQKYALGVQQPIRILVKSGRVTLEGVVDNEADKNTANIRANGVSGVFSVTNNLQVVKP